MTARTFVLGLALGALLTGLPLWLWLDGGDPAAAPRPGGGPRTDTPTANERQPADDSASRADLLAEVERLRGLLEARREVETPEAADGPAEATAPARSSTTTTPVRNSRRPCARSM